MEHEGVVPLARRQTQSTEFPGFAEPSTPARTPTAPTPNRADTAFIGTLAAISSILASRLILLLAVIGGFVLALRSDAQSIPWVLIAYSVLVVIPLVALDIVTRRK